MHPAVGFNSLKVCVNREVSGCQLPASVIHLRGRFPKTEGWAAEVRMEGADRKLSSGSPPEEGWDQCLKLCPVQRNRKKQPSLP